MSAPRHGPRPVLWLVLPVLFACAAAWAARPDTWQPRQQSGTLSHTVYAYRQWQSTGVKLNAGDRFVIRAKGQWTYSPEVGLHGPGGGLPAPPNYPYPYASGGALLGRVGESGEAFYVGSRSFGYAEAPGLLYLRINDDLLGDNKGQLSLDIQVTPAPDG